ncbi:MAG: 16S rRNA (adenine(1518)-N(6)/adenine(1519)-N(6))-dimethyltransferase RsmA [Chloroflexota bacterium]|nr:16S rRNA (adenine(1518)-N(6)/adenine(1519)-N(6))-dimethyltransferase RsmA [Chloroflexota bacterium]MDE2886510.1 16S rRNA (adenine(1518)-N(6)/adenine(1519)-N(6))-dimethyltransferase RsmA [Chloroflexota bacterium]
MAHRAPRKSLGQHFLTDRNILGAIADAAEVGSGDTVIEVGPGRGALTAVLAERTRRVIAVELDSALARSLAAAAPPNVEVVEADARSIEVTALLGGCAPYKMLGNLPYYAAMPILRRFLESDCRPEQAAVLVQREVAEQMCARPGTMSLVSLAVQLFGSARTTRIVRPGSFTPPPKVTSAVVAVALYDSLAEGVDDAEGFFVLARAGFSAPRKQLRNALSGGLGVAHVEAERLLEAAGVEASRRAQTLSMGEWASLYRAWRSAEG